jgi:eukaryotic-like serine/threonine-protein kinase
MPNATCDPTMLSQFLSGELAADAERLVVEHLDTCRDCQQRVEQLAGGQRWWQEAQVFLSPEQEEAWTTSSIVLPLADEWHGPETGDNSDGAGNSSDDEVTAMPISLDFLAPTDEPNSLGRIGTYEVVGVVGRGGTGIVLKAFDRTLNRLVAIKVLAPNLATTAAARRRFARESQAAAAVVHEHIVPIHAVSDQQGLPYLVMQYVPGRSLQQRLDRQGPLPIREILRIGMQTAAGLAAAHAQGLVHRDVKPANIMLENGVERVLITDFGLARTVDEASLTCSGVIAGTPQYMAPEQARGEAIDYRTDLFSLGSVLYALCTGHSPFRAETTMGVLHRICKETPRPIQETNPEIPLWLSAIVGRLHAKNPAKRYSSAAEVAEILQRHLARLQSPSGAGKLSWTETAMSARAWLGQRGTDWSRRIALWAGGVAAVAVVSVVLVKQFLPSGDVAGPSARSGDQAATAAPAPTAAAISTKADLFDDARANLAWQQSLSEIHTRIDSIEDQLHATASTPDRIAAELAALRRGLEEMKIPLSEDSRVEAEPR